MDELRQLVSAGLGKYSGETPDRIKALDLFSVFCLSTAVIQFLYYVVVGSFPFNSFLSGFIAALGTLTLTVCLRVQITSPGVFKLSAERCFADYLVANLFLHLACICFLG